MFCEQETDIDEKCKNFTAKTPSANTLSDISLLLGAIVLIGVKNEL